MTDSTDKDNAAAAAKAKLAQQQDEPMEDEEKIIDGRVDVNYPALLTKDVPGG